MKFMKHYEIVRIVKCIESYITNKGNVWKPFELCAIDEFNFLWSWWQHEILLIIEDTVIRHKCYIKLFTRLKRIIRISNCVCFGSLVALCKKSTAM